MNDIEIAIEILKEYIEKQGYVVYVKPFAHAPMFPDRVELRICSQKIGDEIACCSLLFSSFMLKHATSPWDFLFESVDQRLCELDRTISEKRMLHRQQFRQRYCAGREKEAGIVL